MATYGQYCPVSKAAEVLCPRWTLLVVLQLLTGRSRFTEIQRGLPGCPPATLAKRLRALEDAGIVRRETDGDGTSRYCVSDAGDELYPLLEGFGRWGQRWARSRYEPSELDAESLLWDIRPHLDPSGLGLAEAVVELAIGKGPGTTTERYWIVIERGTVDLCVVDPQRPVDALVDADLRALTRVWMGDTDMAAAMAAGEISVAGQRRLVRRIPRWLGQHPQMASVKPAVRATSNS